MLCDRGGTLESLGRGVRRISWSQFNAWRGCPASYLMIYHAKPVDVEVGRRIDNTFSIAGILIQRFFESWINDGLADLIEGERREWVRDQMGRLYDLIVVPVDDQWGLLRSGVNLRTYLVKGAGRLRVDEACRCGLSSVFRTGIQLAFLDQGSDDFRRVWKSRDRLLDRVTESIEATLESVETGRHPWPFDRTLSEVWINASLSEGYMISGLVDFVIAPDRGLRSVGDLRGLSRYVMLDGKFSLWGRPSPDQLMFYAIGLAVMYGVWPTYMGFWHWQAGSPIWHVFDWSWMERVRGEIEVMRSSVVLAKESLEMTVVGEPLDLSRSYMEFRPSSQACMYCTYVSNCGAAMVAGTNKWGRGV